MYEQLSIVLLLFVTIVLLYLWLQSRQEVVRYQRVYNGLPNPVLRINLINFSPVICNRAFSRALGYASNTECISCFQNNPHLPQQNIYQIYRLWQQQDCREGESVELDVILRDRQGKMVSETVLVRVDPGADYMDLMLDIPVQPPAQGQPDSRNPSSDGTIRSASAGAGRLNVMDTDVLIAGLDRFLEEDRGLWRLEAGTGRMLNSPKWLRYLQYADGQAMETLEDWLAIVAPDDKERVKRAFDPGSGKNWMSVRYRVATGAGIALDIESSGIVVGNEDASEPPQILFGLHRDTSLRSTRALSPGTRHQVMNHLAGISGYAELIHSNEDLPAETRAFATDIRASGEEIRSLLHPEDMDDEQHGLSSDEIAESFGLTNEAMPWITTILASEQLEEIIRHVMQFMAGERAPMENCRLLSPVRNSGHCSFCASNPDPDFSRLSIVNPDLHWAQDHMRRLVQPGFNASVIGRGNPLAEAARRIHQLGGHLGFVMDHGFSVTLFLPAEYPVPGPEQEVSPEVDILVIDDEVAVANYLKEVVTRAGYQCVIFNDPVAALSHFMDDPSRYDLVITDQTMPGCTGDKVLQTLLARRPELPVILCTGYSDTLSTDRARKLGAVACLSKPVSAARLAGEIRRHLEKAHGR